MSKHRHKRHWVMNIIDIIWALSIIVWSIATAVQGHWVMALLKLVSGLFIVWVFRDHDRLQEVEKACKQAHR